MQVKGDIVKLERNAWIKVEKQDWKVIDQVYGVLTHVPTGNKYIVTPTNAALEEDNCSMYELCAALVWLEEGQVAPSHQGQVEFGQAAIVMFLISLGVEYVTEECVERPEDKPSKRRARGLDR
jgi:hypothetical protein